MWVNNVCNILHEVPVCAGMFFFEVEHLLESTFVVDDWDEILDFSLYTAYYDKSCTIKYSKYGNGILSSI